MRPLGLPTVADRVAQRVVKQDLEPEVDKPVHPAAEGYRPGQSALDAVGQARERGWRDDWGLDLDIQGCFDKIGHALRMRAVRKPTDGPWGLLDRARWLNAPVQRPDGTRVKREKGTPPGGGVSPVRANLVLPETCEGWRHRHHPAIPGER
jgi:RNA-directed DNA polymerase